MSNAKKNTTAKAKKNGNVIDWRTQVLDTNKALKTGYTSFGQIRAYMLQNAEEVGLSPLFVDILEKSKKQENYKFLMTLILPNRKGEYSFFNALRIIRKNLPMLQDKFATAAEKKAAEKAMSAEMMKTKPAAKKATTKKVATAA